MVVTLSRCLFSEAATPEGICFKVGLMVWFCWVVLSEILDPSQFLLKLYKIKQTVLAEGVEEQQKTKAFERVLTFRFQLF